MLIPAPRLLIVAGVCLALAIVASIEPDLAPWWGAATSIAAGIVTFDGVRLLREPLPRIERHIPDLLSLGVWQGVVLSLHNRNRRPVVLDIIDHYPFGMDIDGLPARVRLGALESGRLHYRVRPLGRGDQMFMQVEARIGSALALWQVRRRLGSGRTVRVYPNFAAVQRYAAFAMDQRLMQLGVVQQRRRGDGQEFQEERNQQVVFMLDCGRRMLAQDGALSHFDHVLNAALLLASVSLRHGDAVGLITMGTSSAESIRYLAPRRAPTTLNKLLDAVYDLQPTYSATDYLRAAIDLANRVKKRALIVVLTNLHDEETADLSLALQVLRSRHLVVLASLREFALRDALVRPMARLADALTHAAAADYLLERAQAFRKIEGQGAVCVDVEPARLGVALVNRYLQIKRAGRL